MVTYTEWVSIGHEAFKSKGGTYGDDTAVDVTETLASFWQENKPLLKQASSSEATEIAQENMQV